MLATGELLAAERFSEAQGLLWSDDARREFRSEMQNFIWKKSPNSRGRFAVRHELNYWKAAAKTATVSEEEAMQLMPPGARATRAQGRWLCECFGKIRSVSWQSRGNSELMCVFQLAQWSWDLYEQMQTHALNAEPDNGKVQLCWLSEDSADAATLQRLALPWEDSVAILIPILETGDGCGICAVPVGVIPKTFVNSRRVPAARRPRGQAAQIEVPWRTRDATAQEAVVLAEFRPSSLESLREITSSDRDAKDFPKEGSPDPASLLRHAQNFCKKLDAPAASKAKASKIPRSASGAPKKASAKASAAHA
ncbi:unnamed protein product, partial [Effrenium voratum]